MSNTTDKAPSSLRRGGAVNSSIMMLLIGTVLDRLAPASLRTLSRVGHVSALIRDPRL